MAEHKDSEKMLDEHVDIDKIKEELFERAIDAGFRIIDDKVAIMLKGSELGKEFSYSKAESEYITFLSDDIKTKPSYKKGKEYLRKKAEKYID